MCYTLYSEVLKMESTSNAPIRSSLPLAHTGDILVTNVEMWPSAELMDGDNPFLGRTILDSEGDGNIFWEVFMMKVLVIYERLITLNGGVFTKKNDVISW